jgi:diguanylate cyclase (GGDEF)-like protein
MARNNPTDGVVRPTAVRGKNLSGKRNGFDSAQRIAPALYSAHANGAGQPQEPVQTSIEYGPPSGRAQDRKHEVEFLIECNAKLQQDLIELTHKEAQARHLAYHDELTGLPNRSLLQDRFQQAIAQAQRRRKPLALLLLDLDEFKRVNDKLGHASGDKLLKALAERLSDGIRGADTACRYGGDEFVVMLSEIDNSDTAATLAVELGTRLGQPYVVDGYQIRMTVSVGTAVYPTDGKTYDALMKHADLAMYRAKEMGSSVSIFAASSERLREAEKQNEDVSKDDDRGREYGPTAGDDSAMAS